MMENRDKSYQSQIVEGSVEQARKYVESITRNRLCGNGELCRCSICSAINKGVSIHLREFGGQSLMISDVRRAINLLSRKVVKYRSVLFVAISGLSNKSANSLLKLVEEPPLNVQIFINVLTQWVLTTTILSRCELKQLGFTRSGGSYQLLVNQSLESQLKTIRNWEISKQLRMRICDVAQGLWEQQRLEEAYEMAGVLGNMDDGGFNRLELIDVVQKLR